MTSRTPPMTPAERQRAYRKRQREKSLTGRPFEPGNVPANAFAPGNAPGNAFAGGNALAMTHGSTMPSRYLPVAERILAEFLGADYCPDYLKDASYTAELSAWSVAEARVLLLRRWLDDQDLERALTILTTETEDESTPAPGQKKRVLWAKSVQSAQSAWESAERLAAQRRKELGLTPLARARLGRDIAAMGKTDLASYWAQQDEEDAEEERAAAGGAS